MLIVFGIFAALMLAASFRTCIATVVGVTVLTATLSSWPPPTTPAART